MRLTALFVGISLSLAAQASWFGGDSSTDSAVHPYTTWSTSQLTDWLDVHNIALPKHAQTDAELRDLVGDNWNKVSTWTYDQYASAQKAFVDLRESSFDKWDDSRLREFLLEQGVVAPKGPREKLILMAKEKYRAYTNAASSFSSKASSSASSMYYGDKTQQLSRTASSVAAQATKDVVGAFDHTKDYVYSTWDENRMRTYLEEKGVLKSAEQKKKEELIGLMHRVWGKVANPVWEVWSDSYLHNWLVSHNIIEPSAPKNTRDYYLHLMKQYYYSTQDRVWHGWTDSQLRQWLIDNNVIKSDAQVTRDKMVKLVEDNYYSAKDSFWNAWTDNQIRQWLIDNGYVKSDTQKKRDELIKLADEKYTNVSAKSASYLAWPDARLRAYLREHGVNEDMVPGGRPGLLQETRIRWVQAENRADTVLEKIRELVNGGVYKVEDVLSGVMHVLTTGWVDTRRTAHEDYDAAKEGYDDMKKRTGDEYEHAKRAGEARVNDAKARARNDEAWAKEKYGDSREYTGEKVKGAGQKIKGEL